MPRSRECIVLQMTFVQACHCYGKVAGMLDYEVSFETDMRFSGRAEAVRVHHTSPGAADKPTR